MQDNNVQVPKHLYDAWLAVLGQDSLPGFSPIANQYNRHNWYEDEAKQRIADKFNEVEHGSST